MKFGQPGFTAIETVIATGMAAIVGLSATTGVLYILEQNERTNNGLAASVYAEDAGYWLTSDARQAEVITSENLTSPNILVLSWTDWGYGDEDVFHQTTYSIVELSGNVGKLMRTYQTSTGETDQRIVGQRIYFDPGDEASTLVTSDNTTAWIRVAARVGDSSQSREYRVAKRPDFR